MHSFVPPPVQIHSAASAVAFVSEMDDLMASCWAADDVVSAHTDVDCCSIVIVTVFRMPFCSCCPLNALLCVWF